MESCFQHGTCSVSSSRTRCHDLHFLNVKFKPAFSLSSFTFIKRLFSSLLSAIRVVSYAYLRLSTFLLAILIPACALSSPAFQQCHPAYLTYTQSTTYGLDILLSQVWTRRQWVDLFKALKEKHINKESSWWQNRELFSTRPALHKGHWTVTQKQVSIWGKIGSDHISQSLRKDLRRSSAHISGWSSAQRNN